MVRVLNANYILCYMKVGSKKMCLFYKGQGNVKDFTSISGYIQNRIYHIKILQLAIN